MGVKFEELLCDDVHDNLDEFDEVFRLYANDLDRRLLVTQCTVIFLVKFNMKKRAGRLRAL